MLSTPPEILFDALTYRQVHVFNGTASANPRGAVNGVSSSDTRVFDVAEDSSDHAICSGLDMVVERNRETYNQAAFT